MASYEDRKEEVVCVEDQVFPLTGKEGKIIGKGVMMINILMNIHPTRKSYTLRTGKRSVDMFARIMKNCLLKRCRGPEWI